VLGPFRRRDGGENDFRCLIGLLFSALSACVAPCASAQFAYRVADSALRVSRNVEYGRTDSSALAMDVYRPAGSSGPSAAVVFFNTGTGPQRATEFYVGWARAMAAHGVVGIIPDLRPPNARADFESLITHLASRAGKYGIDAQRIAVYAGSGNVFTALPILEDSSSSAARVVKAAVIYYGTAPITSYRLDLPLLYVRAGLDRPAVTGSGATGIAGAVAAAIAQNAPITVINHSFGHHAFEGADDDEGTRAVIEQTIAFVARATSPSYQAALRNGLAEADAAARVVRGDLHHAASAYGGLVADHPNDSRLRLAYGEALLGDQQFARACGEFASLRDKGLGARDLGLPAARACMLSGDANAAIGWLRTIPTRFLPPAVRDERTFTSIRDRAEFRALFAAAP
jgi:hypothetical protein